MAMIAVLADIHGNHPALLACLDHACAHGAEEYWFLGDYLGELAYPQRTLNTLYTLRQHEPCRFLRGNKEEYWLKRRSGADTTPWRLGDSTTGMLAYNYDRLTGADLDWFASLPIAQPVELPGLPPLTLCHGSPTRVNETLYPGTPTEVALAGFATDLTICAHTHRQAEVRYGRKRLWNPGSVGVHALSPGKAQYMLLRGENGVWQPEFCSVPYDVEQAVAQMRAEDLFTIAPAWARMSANLLRHGGPVQAAVLSRAMALCEAEEGSCIWPDIPERYWKQALAEAEV